VNQPGSSAQLDSYGILTYQAASVSNVGTVLIDNKYSPVGPVDLTVAELLQCYCIFSTNTSPANICTQHQFIVEVLN
jgi:hypothetical protein